MPDSAAVAPARVGHSPDKSTLPEPFTAPALLDRPPAQRVQEFRYRFGQSVVFGLPVLALEWFGRSLGGPESERWVALLQALLAGWVLYVAATGMLAEGALLVLTRRRVVRGVLADAVVAAAAVAGYLFSLPRLLSLITRHAPFRWPWPTGFHWVVLVLGLWSGLRWRQLSARVSRTRA